MPTQLGKGHLYGLSGIAATLYDTSGVAIVGYISPNLKTLKLSHGNEAIRIKGQDGVTSGLIFNDEIIECTFDFIPEGSSIANATASAQLPEAGTRVKIAGAPVIKIGSFADALNADTNTPWIYEGGGTLNGESEKEWFATLPLKRYKGVTSATVIS